VLVDGRFVALGKQSEIRMGCDGQIDKVAGKVQIWSWSSPGFVDGYGL
jgi:N-acyl-D-aspartate/D-glutamate deacylase